MPTTENDSPSGSIPLALQRLFYKLQNNKKSVEAKELSESLGWNRFEQQDVQELNRILCEKIEDKMKGTALEGTIQKLFEGHHMNYVECINVDYKSTRKESFYDIQLDVKGCGDVYSSFDKYVEVERLEGDNKYQADAEHGLQDAKKGVLFIDFPPVLQLQLKRFKYDITRVTAAKVNDRYEFPLQLDLDREDGKYLSPDADRRVRNLYTLHSVLVHCGELNRGHYYAFIRPTLSEQWFKFNDEKVTKEDIKQALDEHYGGEEELPQNYPCFNDTPVESSKCSSAYMLVYIRESDRDEIMRNVDEMDIPEHFRVRLKKEQEEKEQHKERMKKEEAEARLCTTVKVARNEGLSEQIGRDIYFDLVQEPFNLIKQEVAKEFGVPVQFQRFWLWEKRRNKTYRLDRPSMHQEEYQPVGWLGESGCSGWMLQHHWDKADNAELKLFLEIELGPELHLLPPPNRTVEDILLFFKLFKLYAAEKEDIRYVGRLYVKCNGNPLEILKKLNEMAGFSPDAEIELYEEQRFEPIVKCQLIYKNLTFCDSMLDDGDIICFQKHASADSMTLYNYPEVPSFLKHVHNRQIVRFRSLTKPKEGLRNLEVAFSDASKCETLVVRVLEKSTVGDVINDLKTMVELSHPKAELRLLEVCRHKIYRIFLPCEKIDNINDPDPDMILRAEEIPEEEKNLGPQDRLIRICHFRKDAQQASEEPFLLIIHEGETLCAIKLRIQKKLQVPDEEFTKLKFAFLSSGPLVYLQDSDIVSRSFQRRNADNADRIFEHLVLEHFDPKRECALQIG